MKKILFTLFVSVCSMCVSAQEVTDSMSIDDVMDACISMQEALENNDAAALKKAAEALRETQTTAFTSLRCKDDTISSLNGHFVFNDVFVDSLVVGANPYDNADDINRSTIHRGQMTNGSKLIKTCMVKAGQSTKYTFASRGRQELGIVAEPGGLITTRIHVTNTSGLNEWHNDTKNPNGTRRYKTAFDLPSDKRNTVELEVINKSGKDISFVVISN
ncbi:MAG: hypothetical protein MJZ32_09755 [Bacteroidaceae bacterium]|nr:hypothetical protein [Bacteroidaceae bacterium]